MPIYEYKCPECGHEFSKLRPISQSDEKAKCEKCDFIGAVRIISTFSSNSSSCSPVGTGFS